jgi:hemerythrin superfamily protein
MPSRTDQLISQGMGKAKVVKAALKGLHGILRSLVEQHGQASGLLMRLKGNADKRAELWPVVRTELLAHERSEMEVLYRELQYDPRTRDMAEHHDQEAGELESLIRQIDAISYSDASWEMLFEQLVDTVQHHVSEEEGEIFPKAQEVLGSERVEAMDATFEDAHEAQKRMA